MLEISLIVNYLTFHLKSTLQIIFLLKPFYELYFYL